MPNVQPFPISIYGTRHSKAQKEKEKGGNPKKASTHSFLQLNSAALIALSDSQNLFASIFLTNLLFEL